MAMFLFCVTMSSESIDSLEQKRQELEEEIKQVDSSLKQVRHRIVSEQNIRLSDANDAAVSSIGQ